MLMKTPLINGCNVMHVKQASSTYIVSAATKQGGGKQRATAIRVQEEKVPTVCHRMGVKCTVTLWLTGYTYCCGRTIMIYLSK